MTCVVAIALHDVSPMTLAASRRLVRLIEEVAGESVRLTHLVVPHHHRARRIDACREFRTWIDRRLSLGDEIALHGLWHLDEGRAPTTWSEWWRRNIMTAREAEFASLTQKEARARIEHGLTLFARCGWSTVGFVPPAWQIDADALNALRMYGLRYATTRHALIDLATGTAHRAPALSLSARSLPRRYASTLWARAWLRGQRREPWLRLALHPIDAQFALMRQTWQIAIASLLSERRAVRKSDLLSVSCRHDLSATLKYTYVVDQSP